MCTMEWKEVNPEQNKDLGDEYGSKKAKNR